MDRMIEYLKSVSYGAVMIYEMPPCVNTWVDFSCNSKGIKEPTYRLYTAEACGIGSFLFATEIIDDKEIGLAKSDTRYTDLLESYVMSAKVIEPVKCDYWGP